MFTVTVGRATSGKSRTRAPLASRYSVTPSIEATFTGASPRAVNPPTSTQTTASNRRMVEALVEARICRQNSRKSSYRNELSTSTKSPTEFARNLKETLRRGFFSRVPALGSTASGRNCETQKCQNFEQEATEGTE